MCIYIYWMMYAQHTFTGHMLYVAVMAFGGGVCVCTARVIYVYEELYSCWCLRNFMVKVN